MNIINIMKLYLKPIFKKIYLSLRYHFGKKFNLIKKQKLNILIITDIKKSISFWHRGRSYFSKKHSHGGSNWKRKKNTTDTSETVEEETLPVNDDGITKTCNKKL